MTKHTRWPAGAQKCCTPKCCRWPRKAKWWCGCAIPSIRRHAAHGLGRPATFPTRFCREVRHEPASSGREEWPNAAKRARKPAGQEHGKKMRSEEHTSELQSRLHLVCRLLLEKKKKDNNAYLADDTMQAAVAHNATHTTTH